MLLLLINAVILLGGVSIPIVAIFWKHFADKPSESIRALIATVAGMLGLAVFFLQVFAMSFESGQNLITMIGIWLGS